MQTSYILKTNKLTSNESLLELADKLIKQYEQSLNENIVFVIRSDFELFKLENGKYIKVL